MDSPKSTSALECNSSRYHVVNDTIKFFRPWELDTEIDNKPMLSQCQDSGYDTDESPKNSPSPRHSSKKGLNPKAVEMMEKWYRENFDHPYPSDDVVHHIVMHGGITTTQVKKWMANKRVRSNNTLTFNGTIHPKRLQRLQKRQSLSPSTTRHHPYTLPEAMNKQAQHMFATLSPWNFSLHPIFPLISPMSPTLNI